MIEVVATLALLAVVLAVAIPRLAHARDVWAVQGAAASLTRAMALGRQLAGQRGQRTALRLDTARGRVVVAAGPDTLARRDLHETFGVRLVASRDSIAWSPSGLGYGAANTRVIVRRGQAADTVTVSRLGRVQR